eukprot:GHVP01024067.1.p1 GENE.GHVP01024067.1~~GHVP01024067.1.p1  ORF type:complete len:211 (-),score=20.74 GHVP01024067.1:330-935(-)
MDQITTSPFIPAWSNDDNMTLLRDLHDRQQANVMENYAPGENDCGSTASASQYSATTDQILAKLDSTPIEIRFDSGHFGRKTYLSIVFLESGNEIFRLEVPSKLYSKDDIILYHCSGARLYNIQDIISKTTNKQVRSLYTALTMFEEKRKELMRNNRNCRFDLHEDSKGYGVQAGFTTRPNGGRLSRRIKPTDDIGCPRTL